MNENLNLVQILKDCPKGTKLYSPVVGEVEFCEIDNSSRFFPIVVKAEDGIFSFTQQGKFDNIRQGECMLFPSKDQRDWSKFKPKKPKFDPKTLQPFDKVLGRDDDFEKWNCAFFSHKDTSGAYHCRCTGMRYVYCIPYNDDTKHLVGTTEEAPEYYRYWED